MGKWPIGCPPSTFSKFLNLDLNISDGNFDMEVDLGEFEAMKKVRT